MSCKKQFAEGSGDDRATLTPAGEANGAASGPGLVCREILGTYSHRTITGGIGHNPLQEAPEAFAKAVIESMPTNEGALMPKATAAPLTVVLVHGAFVGASGGSGLVERPQAAGMQVSAPAIRLRGISIDSAYIASLLEQVPGPVPLAHS